jgi:hypothetical protein
MNRLKISLGIVFLGSAVLAGNFMACGGSSSGTGTAGTSGGAGTGSGAAGTTGAAGTGTPGATLANGMCVVGAYHRPKASDPCTCQEGMTDVCAVVGCTDLATDPDNCGTCGHKCSDTSACNAKACGADPTVLVPAIAGCTGVTLAINGTSVFYADEAHGTINKVGGTAAVVSGEMGPTLLASNGANLYWYNKTTKTIRTVPAAGGTAKDVFKNTATPTAMTQNDVGGFLVSPDASKIYISIGFTVVSAPLTNGVAGTTTIIVQEDHGEPNALALDGTAHIVTPVNKTADVDAPVLNPPTLPAMCGVMLQGQDQVDMTTCPRLGRSQGQLLYQYIAVVNGRAFWVDGPNLKTEMITANGGTFQTVGVTFGQTQVTAITNTTDTLYLAEDGYIEKIAAAVNANAKPPAVIARGQKSPQSIVVDATKVYWATQDCAIASVAK